MTTFYEGLPLCRATAEFVVLLDKLVRGFSRFQKYSFGTRPLEGATEIVLLVTRCAARSVRGAMVGCRITTRQLILALSKNQGCIR